MSTAPLDAVGPRIKRHRVDEAPSKWADLPAEKLVFSIGSKAASTVVSLINSAARCPALTAYDLRWRRHDGCRPGEAAPDVELRRPLLNNENDAPVPAWPGLQVVLSTEQRRSLRWMLAKEAGTDDELVVERGCEDCQFSTHRGIDFQVRLSFTLRGGVLADAMGYGKTLLAIATVAASCSSPLEARGSRQPCGATLIITPENLVSQWLSEFRKALGPTVKARLLGRRNSTASEATGAPEQQERKAEEKHEGLPQVERTENRAHLGNDGSDDPVSVFAVDSADGWAELMRIEHWPQALAVVLPNSLLRVVEPWFCLHRYHWRRIIVDELHEALACHTLADALGLISAQHVWGLSGTLSTATAGDVARAAALFGVSIPIDATNAGRFLDCYVRRNAASATEKVLMVEHCCVVKPTSMERAIYLACQHDFDQPLNGPEAREGYVPAFLSTWRGLQEHGRDAALVKLCCHHEVTAADVEILSTPEQSVERLCVWKRQHCEEAQRLIRRHVVLAEWMARNSAAVSSGKRPALELPEEPPRGGASDIEARHRLDEEVARAGAFDDSALFELCRNDLETTPFAVCDRPAEAEARWLEWCDLVGLAPGTRGAVSRLRKIMYDELWGRLVDGQAGWDALARMAHRNWRADYAAAQRSRLLEATEDFAASLRSCRFLEEVVKQASSPSGLDCGICLQPLRSARVTPCAHVFCAACIERSISTKAECPTCRASVRGPGQLSAMLSTQNGDGKGNALDQPESSSISSDILATKDAADAAATFDAEGRQQFGTKIFAIAARLESIRRSGEKALVFAQWGDLIFKIHAALIKFGIPAAVLAGGAFDRATVLQRFESPDLPVLLLSLEDSASGTNMAHANHVLLVHPMVASSAEEQRAYEAQAIGRVRRWGQRRTVQVWRFVMEGTIERDLAVLRAGGRESLGSFPTDDAEENHSIG